LYFYRHTEGHLTSAKRFIEALLIALSYDL